jgi:hypothetical protein
MAAIRAGVTVVLVRPRLSDSLQETGCLQPLDVVVSCPLWNPEFVDEVPDSHRSLTLGVGVDAGERWRLDEVGDGLELLEGTVTTG